MTREPKPMIYTPRPSDRYRALIAALLVNGVIGYALLTGLSLKFPRLAGVEETVLVDLAPPPKPPEPRREPPPPTRQRERMRDAPAPPNLLSEPTPVVAPPPQVALPLPSPVVAAPIAGVGSAATAGASDRPGPGYGAGGYGDGRGGGGYGDGEGVVPPRWRRGRIRDSDYPAAAGEAGIGGTVEVRYTVEADGRIGDCRISRSSGSAVLDEATCRLIRERFRYEPSRDREGRAVRSIIVENHEWVTRDEG